MQTVFLTVLSGVFVYVLGQIFLKSIIEPIFRQRETIGKIINFLIYHAHRYVNPQLYPELFEERRIEKLAEASETIHMARSLASELMARTQQVPFYRALTKIRITRRESDVRIVLENLFLLSNSMHSRADSGRNYEAAVKIEDALGIVTSYRSS